MDSGITDFLPDLSQYGRKSTPGKILPQCNKKGGNIDAEKMICYTEQ